MEKPNVLIVSKRNADEIQITQKLQVLGKMNTLTATSAEEAANEIKNNEYSLVVFNMNKFSTDKLDMAKYLRGMGHYFPLMAVANETTFDTLLQIETLPNTVLLEKPYDDKDLVGLAQKLITGSPVNQRIFRRFITNQMAHVEVFPTGDVLDSRIFNLSRGGAYLEVANEVSLKKGDIIKVDVKLRQINKRHGFHAKVIWTSEKAIWNKGKAVGIEFLKSESVYAEMLAAL